MDFGICSADNGCDCKYDTEHSDCVYVCVCIHVYTCAVCVCIRQNQFVSLKILLYIHEMYGRVEDKKIILCRE